jgi:uncharacterized protein YjbJ (UPF0337 family)
MKPSTKDEVAGKAHELMGKLKETVGEMTNDAKLEAEGTIEKIGGKTQQSIGQVERSSRSRNDKQTDALEELTKLAQQTLDSGLSKSEIINAIQQLDPPPTDKSETPAEIPCNYIEECKSTVPALTGKSARTSP